MNLVSMTLCGGGRMRRENCISAVKTHFLLQTAVMFAEGYLPAKLKKWAWRVALRGELADDGAVIETIAANLRTSESGAN